MKTNNDSIAFKQPFSNRPSQRTMNSIKFLNAMQKTLKMTPKARIPIQTTLRLLRPADKDDSTQQQAECFYSIMENSSGKQHVVVKLYEATDIDLLYTESSKIDLFTKLVSIDNLHIASMIGYFEEGRHLGMVYKEIEGSKTIICLI